MMVRFSSDWVKIRGQRKVVPDPRELQSGKDRQRRQTQRNCHPGEDLPFAGAFKDGCLSQRALGTVAKKFLISSVQMGMPMRRVNEEDRPQRIDEIRSPLNSLNNGTRMTWGGKNMPETTMARKRMPAPRNGNLAKT